MVLPLVDADLIVSLFGPLRLRSASGFHALNLTGSTRELLAFLLVRADVPTRRDVLVATFWPDATMDKGRSALTTAIWRIKKVLARMPGLSLRTIDDLIVLEATGAVRIDALALRQAVAQARAEGSQPLPATLDALSCAANQCSGVVLEGCDAHWALVEREHLTGLYLGALQLLIRWAEARGDWGDALTWGRILLEADPLNEATHHQMIALYARAGERRRAVMQFETLRRLLREELGVAPDAETVALRNRILAAVPAVQATTGRVRSGDAAVTPM
jgi:DNA-binding SARP family transcriptional activator